MNPLLIGDTSDYHSCWLHNGVFHVTDHGETQMIKHRRIDNDVKFDSNIVFINDQVTVLVDKIIVNDNIVYQAVDTYICGYSNGYVAL